MSTCPIIAIDPGNTQSGYCVIDRSTLRPLEFGKIDNAEPVSYTHLTLPTTSRV